MIESWCPIHSALHAYFIILDPHKTRPGSIPHCLLFHTHRASNRYFQIYFHIPDYCPLITTELSAFTYIPYDTKHLQHSQKMMKSCQRDSHLADRLCICKILGQDLLSFSSSFLSLWGFHLFQNILFHQIKISCCCYWSYTSFASYLNCKLCFRLWLPIPPKLTHRGL